MTKWKTPAKVLDENGHVLAELPMTLEIEEGQITQTGMAEAIVLTLPGPTIVRVELSAPVPLMCMHYTSIPPDPEPINDTDPHTYITIKV